MPKQHKGRKSAKSAKSAKKPKKTTDRKTSPYGEFIKAHFHQIKKAHPDYSFTQIQKAIHALYKQSH